MLLVGEVVIGIYFGLVARILLLTLDTAGRIIAFSSGLANAQAFNPSISEQGSLPGPFLTTLGIMMLFATNMHYMLIRAIVDSYAGKRNRSQHVTSSRHDTARQEALLLSDATARLHLLPLRAALDGRRRPRRRRVLLTAPDRP